jgi:hypothetical protein
VAAEDEELVAVVPPRRPLPVLLPGRPLAVVPPQRPLRVVDEELVPVPPVVVAPEVVAVPRVRLLRAGVPEAVVVAVAAVASMTPYRASRSDRDASGRGALRRS